MLLLYANQHCRAINEFRMYAFADNILSLQAERGHYFAIILQLK